MLSAFSKLSKAEQDLAFPAVPEITTGIATAAQCGTLTLPVFSVDFSHL